MSKRKSDRVITINWDYQDNPIILNVSSGEAHFCINFTEEQSEQVVLELRKTLKDYRKNKAKGKELMW